MTQTCPTSQASPASTCPESPCSGATELGLHEDWQSGGVLLLLLTGPPGAGKSTVATAVHDRLSDDGVANALVEADQLRRCYPQPTKQRLRDHVAFLVRSYRESGHDLILVTETIEVAADYEALVAALEPDRVFFVRLDAETRTLQNRITIREPATWSGLPEMLTHTAHLSVSMRHLPNVSLVVSTETVSADDAATQVLDALAEWRR
jgi:predicted kinase